MERAIQVKVRDTLVVFVFVVMDDVVRVLSERPGAGSLQLSFRMTMFFCF